MIIGHIKTEGWLDRNYLLGKEGDNINAFFNGWSSQNLAITARYVRVEVFGNPTIPATQARELEIYGTPSSGDTQPPAPPFGLIIQ